MITIASESVKYFDLYNFSIRLLKYYNSTSMLYQIIVVYIIKANYNIKDYILKVELVELPFNFSGVAFLCLEDYIFTKLLQIVHLFNPNILKWQNIKFDSCL